MNHAYRIVWSVATATWTVVPETARARGKRGRSCRRLVLLTTVMAAAVLPWEGRAQSVSVAAESGRSHAHLAPNGATVVDIDAANAAGLSHNRYDAFNIDVKGLVLNNTVSSQGAHMSRLAGQVAANANLSEPAKIILNEVVSNHRSMLGGAAEVLGTAADVIVANPYGVTCTGCSFVNADSVTLTTGVPYLNPDQSLGGFDVKQGDILVQGAGLDATQPRLLDLLARSVRLDGTVRARDLAIVAGAHRSERANRSAATPLQGDGDVPKLAIDSTLLGGMYADRIRMVATEAGTGVRVLGEAAASADDFRLDAAGRIHVTGRVTARRALDLRTGETVSNTGRIEAGETMSIRAREVVNQGELDSGGNLDIEAGVVRNESAGAAQRVWAKGAVVDESHGQAYDDGGSGGNRDFFQDRRSTWSETRLFAAGVVPRTATMRAANTLSLTFQSGHNLGGTLSGGNAVILRGLYDDGSAVFRNEGVAEETRRYTSLSTQTRKIIGPLFGIEKYGWSHCSDAGGAAYDPGCRYNGAQTTYLSEFRPVLHAAVHADTVRAERMSLVNDGAQAGAATIAGRYTRLDLTALDNDGGRIEGGRALMVTSQGEIANRSGELVGHRIELTSRLGDITNRTLVSGDGTPQHYASQLGRLGTIAAGGTLSLDAAGQIVNTGGAMRAADSILLDARRGVLFDAVATTRIDATPTAQPNLGAGITWVTGGQALVTQHRGSLSAGADLRVRTDGSAYFSATAVKVGGAASVQAGDAIAVVAQQDQTRTWEDVDTGGLGVNGSLYGTVRTTSGSVERRNVAATLETGAELVMAAGGAVILQGSKIEAGGHGSIDAANVRVLAGGISRERSAVVDKLGILQVYGSSSSRAVDGSVRAESVGGLKFYGKDAQSDTLRDARAVASVLRTGGDLGMRSSGEIRLGGSVVEAGGNLDARAADVVVEAARHVVSVGASTESMGIGWMASAVASAAAAGKSSLGGRMKGDSDNWATLRGNAASTLELGFNVYQRDTRTRDTQATTYLAAALGAAGDVDVNAEKTVTVGASTVAAGLDMRLAARNLENIVADNRQSEQQSGRSAALGSYLTLNLGAQAGLGAVPDGAQPGGLPSSWAYGAGGARLSFMRDDARNESTNALTSRLVTGRDLERRAGDVLRDVGASIEAGRHLTQQATTIVSEAAADIWHRQDQRSQDTLRAGVYGSASAGAPSSSASGQGSSTLTTGVGAGAGVAAGYRREAFDERETGHRQVASVIRAGADVSSRSDGATQFEGTSIQAGGDVRIDAATLDYAAAREVSNARGSDLNAGGDLKIDLVNVGVSGGGDYQGNRLRRTAATATGGNVEAGGNVLVSATEDVRLEGTQIRSEGNVSVVAGRHLTLNAVTSASRGNTQSTAANGSLGGGVGWIAASGGANVGNTVREVDEVSPTRITAATGAIGFLAGTDATLVATKLTSHGGVTMQAGRDLVLETALTRSLHQSNRNSGDLGISTVGTSPGLSSGGVFVGRREKLREREIGAEVDANETLSLQSGRDMTLAGLTARVPATQMVYGGKLTQTGLKAAVARDRNTDIVTPPLLMPAGGGRRTSAPSPGMKRLTLDLDGTDTAAQVGQSRTATPISARMTPGTVRGGVFGADSYIAYTRGDPTVTVQTHGAPFNSGNRANAQRVAAEVRRVVTEAGGDFEQVRRVDLRTCYGTCGGPFSQAQALADATGKSVFATPGIYTIGVSHNFMRQYQPHSNPIASTVAQAGNAALFQVSKALHRPATQSPGDALPLFGRGRDADPVDEQFRGILTDMAKKVSESRRASERQAAHDKAAGFMEYGMAAANTSTKLNALDRTVIREYMRTSIPFNDPYFARTGSAHGPKYRWDNTNTLRGALAKLPNATEVTYRGVHSPTSIWGTKVQRGDVVISEPFTSSSISPHVAKSFADLGHAGHRTVFRMLGRNGKNISGMGGDESEVVFLPGTRFDVQSFQKKGERTYVLLREHAKTPESSGQPVKSMYTGEPVRKPVYDRRVIIQVDSDPVTAKAAQAMADKHPGTRLLRADAEGVFEGTGPSRRPGGDIKVTVVGHGSYEGVARLGGKAAGEIATVVADATGAQGALKKVSLVGCNTNCMLGDVSTRLARIGMQTEVTGRSGAVRVLPTGRKAAAAPADADALGKAGASWASSGWKSSTENAQDHWQKHKHEFPQYNRWFEYAAGARKFTSNPPAGTQTKRNGVGGSNYYNPKSNVFAATNARGETTTMFKPLGGGAYWARQ